MFLWLSSRFSHANTYRAHIHYSSAGANLGALVRFQGLHDNMPTIIQYSSAAMKRIADAEKEAKEKSKSTDV